MQPKLAIDFGTTNSLIAHWNQDTKAAEVLTLASLGMPPTDHQPSTIPSLVYVREGEVVTGDAVQHLGRLEGKRLFRNFKRGIIASPPPPARTLNGVQWTDKEAGETFIHAMLNALPYKLTDIEQLVLTVPVAAFQTYLDWLNGVFDDIAAEKIRIVDESTAAALGYAITEAGTTVLVFDFGGGTLDVSLVQLPEHREKTGGFLRKLLRMNAGSHAAQVIAKAGKVIGGSDIDQWLMAYVLERLDLEMSEDNAELLTACEGAKIILSTRESVELVFDMDGENYSLTLTRAELETLLGEQGFYSSLRHVIDKTMHMARQRGVFKEDIKHVLMVGGMSLMPSVQSALHEYFGETTIRADKPFTAIVEGALQVAAGQGLDDYLIHSYGIRYLENGVHQFDEIIPMGSQLPMTDPIEVMLETAHEGQQEVELVIGEIDPDSASSIEVKMQDGQPVFVAKGDATTMEIIALNADAPLIVPVKPKDKIKAAFTVDAQRQLRVTVTNTKSKKPVIDDAVITTLR